MDMQRAKELLTILADGTDPLTGEVLPEDHVCNKGEIVRALNCAVEALSRKREKPLPENNGKPWTEELDQELCRLFDEGMKKKDLCAHFDRGIGKAAPQEDASEPGQETAPAQVEKPSMTDFKPYVGRKRRSGTGCISEISDHLFEGRYSPKWPDGKKHARNVYAHTREECEEKLKVLIAEMKAEIVEAQRLKDMGEGDGSPLNPPKE